MTNPSTKVSTKVLDKKYNFKIEYELQIAHTNKSLNTEIETIFLSTNTNYSFLSSSLVKEVAKFGGQIDHMVPDSVERDLKNYFKKD